jgi:hypothetical protein
MKLYPLLFLNEAQVFAAQAYKQGLVIVPIDAGDLGTALILVNKNQIKDKNGKIKKDNQGQGVVYGKLDIGQGSEDDFMQTRSADAVKGYGPLLYQAAMYYFEPKWLESDESLTDDSYGIWNKMYEYSEKGVYERRYIGNVGLSRSDCANALSSKPSEEEAATEEAFLAYLKSLNMEPKQVGCYWAYKKTSHEPEIAIMIKEGEKLLATIPEDKFFNWTMTANLR